MSKSLISYINKDRKFGLDLLRTIAILQVVYGHGGWMLKGIFASLPMFDGVELFFVLSGFLIGGILIEIKTFNINQIFNFWKNRWFRTLPNYYLFLIINSILSVSLFNDFDQFNPKYFFFLQNFGFNANSDGWFAESWSLAVEEWFYLLIPCLIILISFVSKKNSVLLSGIILIVSSFIFKYLQYKNLQNIDFSFYDYDVFYRKITFLRFDAISLGILFSVIYKKTTLFQSSIFRNTTLIISLILIIYCVFLFETVQIKTALFLIIVNFVIAIGFALSLPFFSEWKINCNANWITKSIVWISLISYSMYLIHYSIIDKLIKFYFWPDSGIDALITFSLYFALTIGLASLNYILFERKITKLRDKIKLSILKK